MRSLAETQRCFARAVLDQTCDDLVDDVVTNGLSAERRVQVYRNNINENLTSAMEAVFPVVRQLVGEDFFAWMSKEYIRQYRSTNANLNIFGKAFAAFIDQFSPVKDLPYLPDVARLEWACDEVFHAGEGQALETGSLSKVNPDDYANLYFQLHPAIRLLSSVYPVFRIWEVNQPGFNGDENVRLDEGGVHMLIVRRGLEVFIECLEPSEFLLLREFDADSSIVDAYERVVAAGYSPNLNDILRARIADMTLVGFRVQSK